MPNIWSDLCICVEVYDSSPLGERPCQQSYVLYTAPRKPYPLKPTYEGTKPHRVGSILYMFIVFALRNTKHNMRSHQCDHFWENIIGITTGSIPRLKRTEMGDLHTQSLLVDFCSRNVVCRRPRNTLLRTNFTAYKAQTYSPHNHICIHTSCEHDAPFSPVWFKLTEHEVDLQGHNKHRQMASLGGSIATPFVRAGGQTCGANLDIWCFTVCHFIRLMFRAPTWIQGNSCVWCADDIESKAGKTRAMGSLSCPSASWKSSWQNTANLLARRSDCHQGGCIR